MVQEPPFALAVGVAVGDRVCGRNVIQASGFSQLK